MINANIEIVAVVSSFWVRNKIIPVNICVGRWKECGKPRCQGIDRTRRKHVRWVPCTVHADGRPAETAWIQTGNLRQSRVENFTDECGVTAAIARDLIRR